MEVDSFFFPFCKINPSDPFILYRSCFCNMYCSSIAESVYRIYDVLVVIVIDENQENSSIYTQLIKSHGARTSCHVKSLGSYRVQICINPLSTMYISLSCFQVKLLQYYTSKMIIYKRAGAHRNFSNLKAKLLEFQLYMSVLRSSDQKFKFRNFVLFLSCEIGNNMSTKLKWVTSEMAHLD